MVQTVDPCLVTASLLKTLSRFFIVKILVKSHKRLEVGYKRHIIKSNGCNQLFVHFFHLLQIDKCRFVDLNPHFKL